ncbi:MAG: purine-binding chemotaxis protein CheW [Vannielia sp.]|uniref:chemotaxis protein CheW n=1 Tax=Rhodobacterales TaxID=204455 RepID=UPI0020957138|nr:chemotaxis protein CheW [Oceanicola sp. 502str15]MCO6381914.1 chemotaxis protein CheW [Oceanicola sp. 502str15]
MTSPSEETAHDPTRQELLSFHVGTQEYSIDIISVREIRSWTEATPLPHAPPYVRGVINLRGTVLPIIDLAKRLGIAAGEKNDRNVIVVVQSGDDTVGLLVDAVSDIFAVSEAELQAPPDMSSDGSLKCVRALTIHEERMLRVLDLAAVLPNVDAEAA